MSFQEIIKSAQAEFEQILERWQLEISKLRTNRVDPSILDDVRVNCFGQEFPLKQLAVVSAISAKEIQIQPWDASYLEPILAALQILSWSNSALAEKNLIRLVLPPLTEEYRQNFLKLLSEKMEEQRLNLRKIRDQAWKNLQVGEREGLIREDDKYRGKDELDKLVKKYNEKIEEMGEKKKKEILE